MAVPKGTQFLGEQTIGDIIDAVKGVRILRNVRSLASREIAIARSVFKDTIPYARVFVGDGLGFQARPFTIPIPMTTPREYLILVGEQGYTGMSLFQNDKNLLIHELTHVWQGQDVGWAWAVQGSSVYHQATQDDAYAYDKSRYKPWGDYGPEQQAQIVEDWFHRVSQGDNKDSLNEAIDDPRYGYIVQNIRGEIPPVPMSREETSLRSSSTAKETLPPITDRLLIEILQVRYAESDVAGYRGRAARLERLFGTTKGAEAVSLHNRLALKAKNDAVALYFYAHLSRSTCEKLLALLRSRFTVR
jgi:hypothetical protein